MLSFDLESTRFDAEQFLFRIFFGTSQIGPFLIGALHKILQQFTLCSMHEAPVVVYTKWVPRASIAKAAIAIAV